MSQLRASINFSLREKELQQNQVQFSNASPINEAERTPNFDEEIEDNDDDTIDTSEHWEQELKE